MTSLLQLVDKMQQANKIDNLQQVCSVYGCVVPYVVINRILNLIILETSFIKPSIRPIYNIAHMVNAVKQIDEWLGYGANALEVDVKFADDGTPSYFSHGIPCDLGGNCLRWAYIKNYVQALRERTHPDSQKFNSV